MLAAYHKLRPKLTEVLHMIWYDLLEKLSPTKLLKASQSGGRQAIATEHFAECRCLIDYIALLNDNAEFARHHTKNLVLCHI